MNELLFATKKRAGSRPATTNVNPHKQVEQNGGVEFAQGLVEFVKTLPGVYLGDTYIGEQGTTAFLLKPDMVKGTRDSFLLQNEFGHIHSSPDFSLHAAIPDFYVPIVHENGWGESHPMAKKGIIPGTNMMLYSPRNGEELSVLNELLEISWAFACKACEPIRLTNTM